MGVVFWSSSSPVAGFSEATVAYVRLKCWPTKPALTYKNKEHILNVGDVGIL